MIKVKYSAEESKQRAWHAHILQNPGFGRIWPINTTTETY